MQRVTITLEDELADEIDRLVTARGYQNRSAAVRDLARRGIRQAAEEYGEDGPCVAALVYVYDHEARNLAGRLTKMFHDHHDLTVSTMHVHLDHDACLELNVLKGDSRDVKHLADHITSERGVRYGRLTIVPAPKGNGGHGHSHRNGHSHKPHNHKAQKPRSKPRRP